MLSMVKYILFFLLQLSLFTPLIAQQYPTVRFQTRDGLPNIAIRSLYVDSRDILWIGTENGLSKYQNGYFTNLFVEDGLAENNCWAICEDENGHLWFGSYGGGVTSFDGDAFKIYNKENGLVHNQVQTLYAANKKVYIGTLNGLSIMDIDTKEIKTVKGSQAKHPQNYVSGFFQRHGKFYYTTYNNGLYEVVDNGEEFKARKIHNGTMTLSLFIEGDSLYCANKGQMVKYHIDDFIKSPDTGQPVGRSSVWDQTQDHLGNRYLAAWGIYQNTGGLYRFDAKNMIPMNQDFGIDSKHILALEFQKSKQQLFVGSHDKGLYRVSLDNSVVYFPRNGTEVKGIEELNDKLLILDESGLEIKPQKRNDSSSVHIHPKTFKKEQENYLKAGKYIPKHEDFFYEIDYTTPSSLIKFYRLSVHKNKIWISTNIGLFALNETGEITDYLPLHTMVMGFTPDHQLIETNPYHGVRVYNDPQSFDYHYFPEEDIDTPTMVTDITSSPGSTYFSSAFSGLFLYTGGKFKSLLKEGILEEKKIKKIHYTEDGRLLVGGEYGNLYILDGDADFKLLGRYSKKRLNGNSIVALEDYKEYMVVGTEQGVHLISDHSYQFYSQQQGLKHSPRMVKVIGDDLYIATEAGYYKLDLKHISSLEREKIGVQLHNISINNAAISKDNYRWFDYKESSISLNADQSAVSVDFALEGVKHPDLVWIRYRLNPNEEWSPFQQNTLITINHLNHGKYNLEINAFDQHTSTSETLSLLKIIVEPPYYATPWFVVFSIFTLFLLVHGLFWYNLRRQRQIQIAKSNITKRIAETRLEALRSQMNPHFTFNALNSVQYYILEHNQEEAIRFLGQFSSLMRTTLEHSSQAWISLREELRYIKAYVDIENSRRKVPIEVNIKLDSSLSNDDTQVPPMIVQPIIENVFVHAFPPSRLKPKMTISYTKYNKHSLICSIADNGIGFDSSTISNQSKGLSLISERLKLQFMDEKSPITIHSTINTGTTIQVIIPIRIAT